MSTRNEDTKHLLKLFAKLFWDATGDSYLPTRGRDERIILDLLTHLPAPELEGLLKLYFETERGVFSLVFFRCQINELRQKLKRNSNSIKPTVKDVYD